MARCRQYIRYVYVLKLIHTATPPDTTKLSCGGVSITDSVFSVSPKCIGSGRKLEFFAHKYLADQRTGVYFGPLMDGMGAHSPDIFGMWEILVTR